MMPVGAGHARPLRFFMLADFARACCLAFPHVTETVQWEDDIVFKIGGKMFAVAPLILAPVVLSFKCSLDDFADLTERPNIIPAPYLARAHWVALQTDDALPAAELKRRLRTAYNLVFAALPKKTQATLKP